MKNTLLNYDKEELDEFIVSDYFSKDINIFNLIDGLDDYIEIYTIADNDKLERVSLEIYGTTDYWDIILMLNDRNPLFDMPLDYDKIRNGSEEIANTYINFLYSQAPVTDTARVLEFTNEILTRNFNENESFRMIKIIKPSKIGAFLKIAHQLHHNLF